MNEIKVQDKELSIQSIIKDIDNYNDEVLAAVIDEIKTIQSKFREANLILSENLKNRMIKDDATKLFYLDNNGEKRTVTLMNGKVEPDKNAENIYLEAGFDPDEIGEYVFKPVWSKARQAMKLGGAKKEIIEKIFRAKDKYLKL